MKLALEKFPLSMNLTPVGTSRRDVPAHATAGGTLVPLHGVRTARRAVPTRFRGSVRESLVRGILTPTLSPSEGKELLSKAILRFESLNQRGGSGTGVLPGRFDSNETQIATLRYGPSAAPYRAFNPGISPLDQLLTAKSSAL